MHACFHAAGRFMLLAIVAFALGLDGSDKAAAQATDYPTRAITIIPNPAN